MGNEEDEIIYCYMLSESIFKAKKRLPEVITARNFVINKHNSELFYMMMAGRPVIIYDMDKDTIGLQDEEKFDITGRKIFPRAFANYEEDLIRAIIKDGGEPIITIEQSKRVEHWPKYYQTKRKTRLVTGRELLEDKELQEQMFDMGGYKRKNIYKNS